jgi:YHS domain-containing protein
LKYKRPGASSNNENVMSILIKISLFIFGIYLLRKILSSFLGTPKKSEPNNDSANLTNQMVKDPVCGMYMDSRLAVRLENRDGAFYFCSEGCKTKFLDMPSETGASATGAR